MDRAPPSSLRVAGMKPSQARVLDQLALSKYQTSGMIARALGCKQSEAIAVLNALVNKDKVIYHKTGYQLKEK